MSTVYIIASQMVAAQNEINILKAMDPPLPEGTLIVPVFSDADMRGRVVKEDDAVIVATGGWAGVTDEKVKRIVGQFNASGLGDTRSPRLNYSGGSTAPFVTYPLPTPAKTENFSAASSLKNVVLTLDGELIELREVNIEVAGTFGQRTSITATSATGTGVWLADREVIIDLREQRIDDLNEIKKIAARVEELREWLSGVQPVEDEDFPGNYRCGVCHRRVYKHADGCPVTSDK